MGHVGNPRSFRLTHQRRGKPLSGNLNSLLEHRLRYWGSKAALLDDQLDPGNNLVIKTSRASKLGKPSPRNFSGSLLNYLVGVRGRLLYDHPSWRQLWYPANYRGSYAHYYHMWKQSGDVVSRKSSLIRPTKRRVRVSPLGYYSHSYFLGKADGTFISKPMFVSRYLGFRDLADYQFPNSPDLNKPVDEADNSDSDSSVVNEPPPRRVVAQPAPGFVVDPYVYRNKRIMRKLSTRFIYFFRQAMVKRLLEREFKKVTPSLLRRFKHRFSVIDPEFLGTFIDGGRGSHADFAIKRGKSPVDKLKSVSQDHAAFDFFNFLDFKTDSKLALPNVGPISDIRTESLNYLPYRRFRALLTCHHEEQLRTYVKELQEFCKAGIKKRELASKTFAALCEPTKTQRAEYIAARAQFSESSRKTLSKTLRLVAKLRRLRRRAKIDRKLRALLRRVRAAKGITTKKVKVCAKLPRQTPVSVGPKRVKKI